MYGRGGHPPSARAGGTLTQRGKDSQEAFLRYKPHQQQSHSTGKGDHRHTPNLPLPPPPSAIRSMTDLSRYDDYTAEFPAQVYRPGPKERSFEYVEVPRPSAQHGTSHGTKVKPLIGSFHHRPPWETILATSSSQAGASSKGRGGGSGGGGGNSAVHFFTEAQEDYLLKLVDAPQIIPWLAEVERKNWIQQLSQQQQGPGSGTATATGDGDGDGDGEGANDDRKRKREEDL